MSCKCYKKTQLAAIFLDSKFKIRKLLSVETLVLFSLDCVCLLDMSDIAGATEEDDDMFSENDAFWEDGMTWEEHFFFGTDREYRAPSREYAVKDLTNKILSRWEIAIKLAQFRYRVALSFA